MPCRFPIFLALVLTGVVPSLNAGDLTRRVSLDSTGGEAGLGATSPSVSGDGRFVAFQSASDDLVPADTNGRTDIFVHDRLTGETIRASITSSGDQSDDLSWDPAMSADGRWVAFWSRAQLAPEDQNSSTDIYVFERVTRQTTLVSVSSSGVVGNRHSASPSISADGRFVAFQSQASNLVPQDGNEVEDIFVRDRQTGITTRVSVDSQGFERFGDSFNPSFSADGRFVAFESWSEFFPPDPFFWDIFVHDLQTADTVCVSVSSTGERGNHNSLNAAISGDGRYVAFDSTATNLVAGDTNGLADVFLHDRVTARTTRLSLDETGTEPTKACTLPHISQDGRRVTFGTYAMLDAGDTNSHADVYVVDPERGLLGRASVASDGTTANDHSSGGALSADGDLVVFTSAATNLVPDDLNDSPDAFVRGRELTLQAEPTTVSGGDLLTLSIYVGAPGRLASLWVVDIDDILIFHRVVIGKFPPDGRFNVSGQVPGDWPQGTATLRAYCIGADGFVTATNDADVTMQ